MNWQDAVKATVSILVSFGMAWGTAILSDVEPIKALASGLVAAGTWWLGNQQKPVSMSK